MEQKPYLNHREAALALLNGSDRWSRKEGGFLGQLTVDASPLTDKQAQWLGAMLKRAALPPMSTGDAP